jgi:hypothetical protein
MTGPEHEALRQQIEALTGLIELGAALRGACARRDAINDRIGAIPLQDRIPQARPLSIEVAEAIGAVCEIERRIAAIVVSAEGAAALTRAQERAEADAFGLGLRGVA